MIDVLIVDDDQAKVEQIQRVVRDVLMGIETIKTVANASEAQTCLEAKQYDVLILDMNIPLRVGQAAQKDGGMSVIRRIDKHKDVHAPKHIVGITGFKELADKYSSAFAARLRYLIESHEAKGKEWRERLGRFLVDVANSKIEKQENYQTDLGIVTALQAPELDAILDLPGEWQRLDGNRGDSFIFYRGTFSSEAKELSVVAATATRMGMPASTALATQMIQRFRPRHLAMAGIAAGVKGNFGDILVADRTFDYGSGKNRVESRRHFWILKKEVEVFDPDPNQIPLNDGLKSRFGFFRSQKKKLLERIRTEWPDQKPDSIECRIGPLASGAAVLENKRQLLKIREHNRKLVGIEMETYGVFLAAQLICDPKPLVFSAKSICDFADPNKGDSHQEYAAYTSAAFIYHFALDQLATNSGMVFK